MSAWRQLPLPFFEAPEYSSADFLDSSASAEARAWLARPADWPAQRLALWGEGGVGKSHLLHLWARRAGASILTGPSLVAPITPPASALALDDADLFAVEAPLLHLLNAIAETGFPLLMAGRTPPARWPVSLPDLASRLAATASVQLGAPDEALLATLFARLLSARQLVLDPPLASFLLARLPRHPAALVEAAALLDRAGLAAQRPLTRGLALTALAPLLGPEPDPDSENSATASPSARPLL